MITIKLFQSINANMLNSFLGFYLTGQFYAFILGENTYLHFLLLMSLVALQFLNRSQNIKEDGGSTQRKQEWKKRRGT